MTGPDTALERLLVCPRCHGSLEREADALLCIRGSCGFRGMISEGIVSVLTEAAGPSFFDAQFPVMIHGSEQPESYRVFYAQQVRALDARLHGAKVVLDVGCGPKLTYERRPEWTLIGLDLSFESLRQNRDVDVRLYGSAAALPLPRGAADAIICLYSLHHMIGGTVQENERLVGRALGEFARVLRQGGDLLVFEVTPWQPVWVAQRLGWNLARRVLGRSFDMFFWGRRTLLALSEARFPPGTRLTRERFRVPAWALFPPAFALQRIRIPRFLYPFDMCLYHWRMG